MRRPASRPYLLPTVITVALLALVLALAVLQWRWIGEVSQVERQRMRTSLSGAAARFAEDFDREVARAALYFRYERLTHGGVAPGPRDRGTPSDPEARWQVRLARLAAQLRRWQVEAPFPQLVARLDVVRVDGDSEPTFARLGAGGALEPEPWPADLLALRERFRHAPGASREGDDDDEPDPVPPPDVTDQPWTLVLPAALWREPLPGGGRRSGAWVRAYVVVELDRSGFVDEFLPELMRRHFGSAEGGEYVVAIVDVHAPGPGNVVFRSDPDGPAVRLDNADLRHDLFAARPFDDLRSLARTAHPYGATRGPRIVPPRAPGLLGWTLLALRRDGSLEAAVEAARRRNLEVSAGVLGLLVVTAVLLLVTTQRAQRLARQQLEFVAGVSHELNTPLTAIRAAGENLADGVVADPAQVRRYGAMIENEGRRLSSMVGQVLEFAGMQSRRPEKRHERVAVAAWVDRALEECRWLLEENRVTVERRVAAGLPAVVGDAAALGRALQNLIENAVKYGGRAAWVGVAATAAPDGGVDVTVSDRGPGLQRDELAHLFEPFFRGRDARSSGVPGSGLGLSLVRHIVEAHGGTVTAGPSPHGGGSSFRIRLPAAPPEPALVDAVRGEEPA